MQQYADITRIIAEEMKPGQCLNVPFNDIPAIPDWIQKDGRYLRSPIDEILEGVYFAPFRIVPSVHRFEQYYKFCYLPTDQWLDDEGDVRTWVYYDRREYFDKGNDGLWHRNHAAVEARHKFMIEEHLKNRTN